MRLHQVWSGVAQHLYGARIQK